eukprot:CAMPEP_0176475320 /NCGR_PEP_ID=MMETSP0127-20121128/43545_1 /TAXON_ID=938130 /ORGANISM="Platyophrya macrostoma, Strain WH" /LENGTH=157 /DNA_ID=CAMNT_0017870911 /DNA_START=75 /DNA_END=548 /DNA_ORIENTATION=-
MTTQEKEELRRVFGDLDTAKNGILSKDEIKKGLTEYRMTDSELDEVFRSVDKDNSGAVEYTEFLIAAADHDILLSKEKLEHAFKLFDINGDGFLTFEELDKAIAGVALNAEDWKNILEAVDDNSDGKISLKEFVNFMIDAKIKRGSITNIENLPSDQ